MFTYRIATKKDANLILDLYNSVKGKNFCIWNEHYPIIDNVISDLTKNIVLLFYDKDILVGAGTIMPKDELEVIEDWVTDGGYEVGRIVLKVEYQGKGYSKDIVTLMLNEIKKRNIKKVHLAVASNNTPAIKTYIKLGFKKIKQMDAWTSNYIFFEKDL